MDGAGGFCYMITSGVRYGLGWRVLLYDYIGMRYGLGWCILLYDCIGG